MLVGISFPNLMAISKKAACFFWGGNGSAILLTLPETNIAHENFIFPGKFHQNGGLSKCC